VTDARLWLIHLSSGQAVVVFSLDIAVPPLETIDLLEDCYHLDFTVDGTPLETYVREHLAVGRTTCERLTFEPERHQLVFCGPLPDAETEEITQKLIYRSDLPYRKEFSAISYPHELNRRPGSTAAVGPYVSMLSNQQDYIENAALLSAIQAVASWVRLREIRETAYADLRLFRDTEPTRRSLLSRRHTLERVVNQLSDLELELSYTVESPADLEILVPSLRVASYHNALFDCMGLCGKAETVGRMLGRLDRSVRAEFTAIESIERRADDDRRLRWTVAVGFLSTVALPITLALAFFGVNAREVDQKLSMFDSRYLPLYVFIAAIVALGVFLSLGLYLQQRLALRREADNAISRSAVPSARPVPPPRPAPAFHPRPSAGSADDSRTGGNARLT
jgi:hypothetical protein